mmetsp:Transcript_54340/g.99906  ORF Transcript_54340/g.99906 Transcript_54340/m.99906 type:complete len:572 (+) Transcript_54340:39-1754(+)
MTLAWHPQEMVVFPRQLCSVVILGLSFAQHSSITAQSAWPGCQEEGRVFRHKGMNGIFLDLTDVGAKEGCWQEDCTKTDKFVCPSPAECAVACTHVEVCKFWTYEPGIRKCFLRSSDAGREENIDFVSGARECNPNAGSERAVSRVSVPFARAALWAAELAAIRPCDTGIGTMGCDNPYAAMAVWRYAVNNLRLAVNALPQKELNDQREVLQYIQQVAAAISGFYRQPTAESFQVAVTNARTLFSALQGWLQAAPATEIPVPAISAASLAGSSGQGTASLSRRLANGREIPLIAFGTWYLVGQAAYDSTIAALRVGYRHIDTAQSYMNEREVGFAIRDSGVPRSEIFLATKCSEPDDFFRLSEVFEAQLLALGTDYLDLYMLHYPASKEATEAAWRTLEQLYARGKVRSLGVSNFGVKELEALLAFATVKPVVVQNKFSVYNPGEQQVGPASVLDFVRNLGIQMMGYSVMNAWPFLLPPMEDPHIQAIAARYQRTPAQVLHRWALQKGVGILPRSSRPERIQENARILDFELSDLDMRLLSGLVAISESLAGVPFSPAWAEDFYGVGKIAW